MRYEVLLEPDAPDIDDFTERLLAQSSSLLCVDALAVRAHAGDSKAQAWLGLVYELGHGVPQDVSLAARWYEVAAASGAPAGWFGLGLLWESGRFGYEDLGRAQTFYRRAADLGHEGAIYRLRVLGRLEA